MKQETEGSHSALVMTTNEMKPDPSAGIGKVADFVVRHRYIASVLIHNVLFALALLMAFLLWMEPMRRFGHDVDSWFSTYLCYLAVFLIIKTAIFGQMGLFRGWWQYAGIRDVVNILLASWVFLMVAYAAVLVLVYLPRWLGKPEIFQHSNGVLVLDFMASVFIVCTARLGVRLYQEELRPVSAEGLRRVLVIGAGNTAEMLLREINRMSVERYRVVGLVDDDPTMQGVFIHGIEVMGTLAEMKDICAREKIDEILIAVPSASRKELRHVIELCEGTKLHFQALPSMDQLIDGAVTVNQIRKVEIKDLLGREAVKLDTQAVGRFLQGRRVLITGAGGSIGSEMCRQVSVFAPAKLILLEQAENNLFDINNEIRRGFPAISVVPVIADIYDRARILSVFEAQRPDVVIHAAAHKHVPLMELNPCEAIKNNILGTKNVADAACQAGVSEFVVISTDKAVNPSSIMGCTKRVVELYTQGLNGRNGCRTQFKSVRFGNVLGSAGSVVPTFERQIRAGGPVTITHPEMTRYFMTIPEAAQLVLQAAAGGEGGQIFLLDMGEPVKIMDLARDMITLSGLRVGDDIDIVFSGVRPGEKLFEELRTEGEDIAATLHPKIKVWNHRGTDWALIQQTLAELSELVNCPDRAKIVTALQRLVPEYTPLNPPDPNGSQAPAAPPTTAPPAVTV
jgi:FlaA1/EpsC-like NDP-sugar epimerase